MRNGRPIAPLLSALSLAASIRSSTDMQAIRIAGAHCRPSGSNRAVQCRQLHGSLTRNAAPSSAKRSGPSVFRDERIRAPRVRLVDPQTNELMAGALDTRQLLSSIDRKRFSLVQVSAGSRASRTTADDGMQEGQEGAQTNDATSNGNDGQGRDGANLDDLPIVKLVDKKEEYDRQRTAKKQKQQGGGAGKSEASLHKEVLLTWSSTMHDVRHKLHTVRNNLLKRGPGATCTVVISTKKGKGGGVDSSEKAALLAEVEKFLCDWSDVEVSAAGDGEMGADATSTPANRHFYARRRGEVEWQSGGRVAMLKVEVVRR